MHTGVYNIAHPPPSTSHFLNEGLDLGWGGGIKGWTYEWGYKIQSKKRDSVNICVHDS